MDDPFSLPMVVLAVLEHTSPPLIPLPNFSDPDPPRHALVLAQVFGINAVERR